MTTLANALREIAVVHFMFRGGRSESFGALLVALVLFAVVAWVLIRSDRDTA